LVVVVVVPHHLSPVGPVALAVVVLEFLAVEVLELQIKDITEALLALVRVQVVVVLQAPGKTAA
jgi:hypothetical protein